MIHNNIDPYRSCHKSNINQSNVCNLYERHSSVILMMLADDTAVEEKVSFNLM